MKRLEKEGKQLYLEGRMLRAEEMNLELEAQMLELQTILEHTFCSISSNCIAFVSNS